MIYEYRQIQRRPKTLHELAIGNEIIGSDEIEQFGIGKLNLRGEEFLLDGKSYELITFLRNNERIATIEGKLEPTKTFWVFRFGYAYFELNFSDYQMKIYESGLGPNQHYYTFYCNDVVVAVIHKPDRVIDYQDSYTCYLEDEKYLLATAFFILFLEGVETYDYGERGNSDVSNVTITKQKELIAKYDPAFISRIKARDGIY